MPHAWAKASSLVPQIPSLLSDSAYPRVNGSSMLSSRLQGPLEEGVVQEAPPQSFPFVLLTVLAGVDEAGGFAPCPAT